MIRTITARHEPEISSSKKVELASLEKEKHITKSYRQTRRLKRKRQQRIRSLIFSLIVLGVLGFAGYLLKPVIFRTPPPPMAGNVIDIAADMAGFSMKEIRLKAGEPVTIPQATMSIFAPGWMAAAFSTLWISSLRNHEAGW